MGGRNRERERLRARESILFTWKWFALVGHAITIAIAKVVKDKKRKTPDTASAPPPAAAVAVQRQNSTPHKRKSFTFIQFWWVNLLLCVACGMNCISFYHFAPLRFFFDGIHIVLAFLLFHHDALYRSNRMVESQSVLIKWIKYSLDSVGHKLIIRCSVSGNKMEKHENNGFSRVRWVSGQIVKLL